MVLVSKGKKMKIRLVVVSLPPDQAAERRRKARQNKDKRLNHSKEYYELLGYSIFTLIYLNPPAQPWKSKNYTVFPGRVK